MSKYFRFDFSKKSAPKICEFRTFLVFFKIYWCRKRKTWARVVCGWGFSNAWWDLKPPPTEDWLFLPIQRNSWFIFYIREGSFWSKILKNKKNQKIEFQNIHLSKLHVQIMTHLARVKRTSVHISQDPCKKKTAARFTFKGITRVPRIPKYFHTLDKPGNMFSKVVA